MQDFSNIVLDRLEEIGMTKYKLAKSSKISTSHIINLLKGRRKWNDNTKIKVCEILGIEIKTKYKYKHCT